MSNGPPSRDRRSLQDLAKLASSPTLSKTPPPAPVSSKTPAPPPVSSKTPAPPSASSSPDELAHDSGIVDLKMIAQADEGAAERSQRTALASAPLFDEEETPARPSSPAPAAPSSGKAIPASAKSAPASSPKPTGSGVRPRAAAAVATPSSSSKTPLILGLSALLLIGVGGAYFLLRGWSGSPAPVAGSATPAEPAAAPGSPGAATPAAATPAASAAAATPSAAAPAAAEPDNAVATDEEAKSPTAGAHPTLRRGAGARRAAAGSGGTTVSPLSAMMASATAATPPPPPDTPLAPAPAGALGEAVQHAVGANGAAPQTAPAAPVDNYHPLGSVPQTPSQGAITSALGSVLPTARACLNPEDPISKAHITFGSSGSVTAVKVTGHAAGTPVEGCIKSALLKATVPAFADSSFGATVTVRPN